MGAKDTSLYGITQNVKDDDDFMATLLEDTRTSAAAQSSMSHAAAVSDFFASAAPGFSSIPLGGTVMSAPTIQENPFSNHPMPHPDLDSQIEAELQELGGRMAGSILDF
jgi:hypothetical protein